ncbi:MAG: flagellar export chaperone FlgN [Legionella sp.]|nr:flagellar export chaperone FlgN [Legionella sp.]
MSYDPDIENIITQFIGKTQRLISLLKDEGDNFRENNLTQIELLAHKKNEVQVELAKLLDALQALPFLAGYQGSIHQKLSAYAAGLTGQSMRAMQGLLAQMQASVVECEHLMTINKQVIRHNQNYLQNLCSTLIHHHVKTDAVTYGKTGELQHL